MPERAEARAEGYQVRTIEFVTKLKNSRTLRLQHLLHLSRCDNRSIGKSRPRVQIRVSSSRSLL